jgi:hypothetical protein
MAHDARALDPQELHGRGQNEGVQWFERGVKKKVMCQLCTNPLDIKKMQGDLWLYVLLLCSVPTKALENPQKTLQQPLEIRATLPLIVRFKLVTERGGGRYCH